MKKAIVVAHGTARSDHGWREAFSEGLSRRGWDARMSLTPDTCDLLVMWGTRRQDAIARQKTAGGEVCILERGDLGDRTAWTSVSFGGSLNGRAEFRGVSDNPGRFHEHFANSMQPWRRQEGYALLIGQVPGDMSIRGVDIAGWYRETHAALMAAGWRVLFRPHPLASRYREEHGIEKSVGTLAEALASAGLCVTFNSNTGVEAVLAGVPTLTFDRGAMAWPVAGHTVREVITPDREAWAHELSWKQWSFDEIRSGECQERIGL